MGKQSEDTRRAAEEAVSAMAANFKHLEGVKDSMDRMSNLLATERAEKEKAQAEAKHLAERLAALEEAESKQAKKKQEREPDGCVGLDWTMISDAFEVVSGQ